MKKIISIILACAVVFSMIAVQADEVTSGVCGDNITWRFEGDTLYMEGTGPMYNYEDGKMPWIQFKDVMSKVYISDGITSVGNCAFSRIGGIKEIYIPDSIEKIGNQAFFRSLNMEEFKMPANLKSVGDYGFRYTNVYRFILNPNASYPGWCFDGCGVGEVVIPAGMKALPSYLFVGCTGLKKINFPEGMTTLGNYVFDACTGLESISLPKSMTSVGNGTFRGCTKLNEVIVLNPKMRFGSDTFLNVEALTILAESGSAAETYALTNNITFKPINVIGKNIQWLSNKGVLRIEGKGEIPDFEEGAAPWDSEADEIKTVMVGEGITSIGNYAFAGLGEVDEISLPTTLNSVADTAFGDMEFLKILSENFGKVPLGTIYSTKILKADSNEYSLMMGIAVSEEEEGEDGTYVKTKGATFIPIVLDADTKGVVNFSAETAEADDDDTIKSFIWKHPDMVDFKANAEQGTNELPAEQYAYINDGKIKISGSLGNDVTGEVTLLIVPAEYDMVNGEDWMNATVVHADTQQVGSKGEYEFKVAFAEEGEYKAYIGNPSLKTPCEVSIIYTNKTNSEQAISDINNAATLDEMVEIVNRKMSLQLFSELYDAVIEDEDMVEEASELLLDYLKDETVSTGEEAQAAIYKAFAITLINNDKLEDVTEYAKEIFADDTEAIDYIKFAKSDNITEIVESRKNDSIKQFDENYAEGILRVLIQYNNGTDEIKNALTKYADLLGIKESKITKSVCMSMAGKKFESLDEIADYVTDYKAPSTGGGGKGPSSGGLSGGSSIKKNDAAENYNNNRFENTKTEAESTGEIKIKPFDDLVGYEWAEDSIIGLFKKGIVSGKAEKSFCPQDNITREEFAKLVAMAVNINVKSGTLPFEDVSTEDWFYSHVKKLYSAGVITGISETMFGTGTNITRQDAVVMIDRAMDKCGLIAEEYEKSGDFGDSDKISDYAVTSVEKLKSNGMITGDDNNNFNPEDSITRAESAVLLYRVYEKVAAAE